MQDRNKYYKVEKELSVRLKQYLKCYTVGECDEFDSCELKGDTRLEQ